MSELFDGLPQAAIALDVETNARDARCDPDFRVLGVSYATTEKTDGYISLGHRPDLACDSFSAQVQELQCLVARYPLIAFHNAKFDLTCLARIGISLWDTDWWDTLLMQHMVDENLPSKELDYLGKHYFNEGKQVSEQFKNFIKTFGWEFLPEWMAKPYAIQDARLTLKLFAKLYTEMVRQGFVKT